MVKLLPSIWSCAGCGRRCIGYRRLPCRVCGSTNRIYDRTANDRIQTRDKAG